MIYTIVSAGSCVVVVTGIASVVVSGSAVVVVVVVVVVVTFSPMSTVIVIGSDVTPSYVAVTSANPSFSGFTS